MTTGNWRLIELTAHLLTDDEREVVLGDLMERKRGGLLEVLGLVMRRQAALWKGLQPWLASFGLAVPASFILMGYSLSVSSSVQHVLAAKRELPGLLSQVLLLVAWSWTAGFIVGAISRRTLWVSVICTCLPCLFCLARFRESSLPRFCLLLFLAPAVWGACMGVRRHRIKLRTAVLLAVTVTILMIPMWEQNLLTVKSMLIWPAWYIVANAWLTRS